MPWAEVFVGSQSVGITPMPPMELPPGRHTFVLKNSQLGVTKRVTVRVTSGGIARVRADLFPEKR
jgi:hypothetical protein